MQLNKRHIKSGIPRQGRRADNDGKAAEAFGPGSK
jgi:hypothetical protein